MYYLWNSSALLKEEQQQAFEMRNIKWIFTALEEGSGRENEISPLTLLGTYIA